MTEEELKSVLRSYEKALMSFGKALKQPKTEWVRDSAIQRFEYTFELAWKSIKRFAQKEDMECHSPLQAFRAAFKLGWIEDDGTWLDMRDDRNRTSHTYNESTAEDIYSHLQKYETKLNSLLNCLKQLVDSDR